MSLSHPVQPTVQRKADFDVGSVFVVYSGGSGFIQISLGKLFCCFERCCELSFTKYLTGISLVAVCTRYPCIVYHHNNACSNFSATIYWVVEDSSEVLLRPFLFQAKQIQLSLSVLVNRILQPPNHLGDYHLIGTTEVWTSGDSSLLFDFSYIALVLSFCNIEITSTCVEYWSTLCVQILSWLHWCSTIFLNSLSVKIEIQTNIAY